MPPCQFLPGFAFGSISLMLRAYGTLAAGGLWLGTLETARFGYVVLAAWYSILFCLVSANNKNKSKSIWFWFSH